MLMIISGSFFFRIYPRSEIHRYQLSGFAQGTSWSLIYYASDSSIHQREVDSILISLDSSLSIYKPYSEISRFNKSGKGILLGTHLNNVVKKSLDTYQKSGGLFDITVQPLVEAWGFSAKKILSLPDSSQIKGLLGCVGSQRIAIQGRYLKKEKACVKIDVDGIAQGYSVDVISNFIESKKIMNYLVELGGEIRVKGRKVPGTEKMKIGIEAPGDYDMNPTVVQKIIYADEGGITTSGSFRKYFESEGKKFSHNIDPKTGFPTQNEVISVTVYAPDAITADAYDNVFMAMGIKKSFQFLEKRKDLAAYFIYRNEKGGISDTASDGFNKLFQP
ncbi:MAG: FAD:protein FMN transferase [Bacteroidetes bacterium]|nr:MAG: FAD:protein FMN transferase [Bacteroidota bacterium]